MRLGGALGYPLEKVYSCFPLGIRYGKAFRHTYRLLVESMTWKKERFVDYQLEQIRALTLHAYENVPFYRKRFDSCGFDPRMMKDLEDIERIPILSREEILGNLDDMTSRNMPRSAGRLGTTGGSTGAPLAFYTQKGFTRPRELAFNWFSWNRMKIHYRDTLGILRGARLQNGAALYEKLIRHNSVLLNSYQLSEKNYPRFVEAIRSLCIDYIRAYPSTIVLLAKHMCDEAVSLRLKAVLTSSENLHEADRGVIRRAFNCKVYDLYGQSECVVYIAQCEECDLYHVDPLYGYTEFVSSKKEGEGKLRKIIGTSFNNYYMPLIRYDTGDVAEYSGEKCQCGFGNLTVKGIVGREREYVVSRSNRIITLTALVFAQHFEAFNRIFEMQIVQNEIGVLVVRVVPKASFSDRDEKEIVAKMISATSNDIEIHVELAEEIERTNRGKKLFLIQNLDLSEVMLRNG